MQFEWLIIDGYNVLHTQHELSSLMNINQNKARNKFIRLIEEYCSVITKKTSVIFDGKKNEIDPFLSNDKFEVIFSSSKLTADGFIERAVNSYNNPEKICVITSDRLEERIVSALGASVQSAAKFMELCKNNKTASYSSNIKPAQKPKLGDFFPNGEL